MAYMSNVPKKFIHRLENMRSYFQTKQWSPTETSSQQMKYNILNQWSRFLALGVQLNVEFN